MWGLYENLPPPSSSASSSVNSTKTNQTELHSAQSQKDEWSVEAKLLAPALRRKTAAAAHVKVKKTSKPISQQHKRELAHTIQPSDLTNTLEQTPIQSGISALWSGVQDAYDPLNPNDYEKVLEDRKKQRTQEPSRVSAAFAPPPIYHQEDKVDEFPVLSTSPFKPQTTNTNVAAKIMAKMGYKEGQGLGKTEQGITTPLVAKKADNRTALIVLPEDNSQKTNTPPMSRVLLLLNVVGPGEVDEYLKPEIQEECAKFGPVDSCKIFEDTKKEIPPEQAVRIFVCFSAVESSQKGLHGRYFGGRVVQAFYFDEARFQNNDLKFSG